MRINFVKSKYNYDDLNFLDPSSQEMDKLKIIRDIMLMESLKRSDNELSSYKLLKELESIDKSRGIYSKDNLTFSIFYDRQYISIKKLTFATHKNDIDGEKFVVAVAKPEYFDYYACDPEIFELNIDI